MSVFLGRKLDFAACGDAPMQVPALHRQTRWAPLQAAVTGIYDLPVRPCRQKRRCRRSAVGRGQPSVGSAVQGDRGHRDGREQRKPALDIFTGGESRRRGQAVAVGMNLHVNMARGLECRRVPIERGSVEAPALRVPSPQGLVNRAPAGSRAASPAPSLKAVLLRKPRLDRRRDR